MASIRPRSKADGTVTFAVLWREPGTSRQTSWTLASYPEAVNFKRLIEANHGHLDAALAILTNVKRTAPTIRAMVEEHITGLSSANARTRADYRRDAANHINPHLGHLHVDELTASRVRHWVQQLAAADMSDKTIHNVHALLSATMASAVEAGHCQGNPCRGIKLPRSEAEHENVALTHDQWRALKVELGKYVKGHYVPLYETLIATGLRWGEATALQVRDIKFGAEPSIRVAKAVKRGEDNRTYVGPTKTRRSRRTVPLPKSTADMLREHVAGKAPADLVFPGPQGGRILASNARARAWLPAVRRLQTGGVIDPDVTPRQHDLRHTYATWQLGAGVDVLTVQRNMGHESSKTTTDTYADVLPAQARRSAEIMDGML
jgi:integrase